MSLPDATAKAWQAALAAEHRAVFGYGLLGPRLSGAERLRAEQDFASHEAVRDATDVALGAAGQTPVGPEADYPALFPVGSPAAARQLAVRLEDDAAGAWRYLFAAATQDRVAAARRVAQGYLTASAVRAARWRGTSEAFPGI